MGYPFPGNPIMLEITNAAGQTRQVKLSKFPALDGWEIQNQFVAFATAEDKDFRRMYTLEVLKYAVVVTDNGEIPLTTDALIDNHLQSWQNVQAVFEAVLMDNGINPKTHAEKPHYWADAGAEMAIAFIAEATKLMGPGLRAAGQVYSQE
jgi:hypothetical protein